MSYQLQFATLFPLIKSTQKFIFGVVRSFGSPHRLNDHDFGI